MMSRSFSAGSSLLLAASLVAAYGMSASCGDSASNTVCQPEVTSFCLCRGNIQGTHQCNAEGTGFSDCETEDGPCEEVNPTTATATTSAASTATSSTSTSTSGQKKLYELCEAGIDCESGRCENHFCTLECANYMECNADPNCAANQTCTADCVRLSGGAIQVCAPYCFDQTDCDVYGPASECGAAQALDDPQLYLPICADWGSDLQAMPDGQPCTEDVHCHLGLTGRQIICIFETCSMGCIEPADCPTGTTCSANGGPGMCE